MIVEKHSDGYVAYPLGLKGIIVGEGDTYEEALADVKSAIRFHIETFGQDDLDDEFVKSHSYALLCTCLITIWRLKLWGQWI